MLKKRTKEIILCVVTLIVLVLVTTTVFASDIEDLLENANNSNVEIPVINANTAKNNVTNNNTVNNNVTNNNVTNNNTSNRNRNINNNSTMPNTGVDYSIVFIIAICGISAVYAYKKIRDYNNI